MSDSPDYLRGREDERAAIAAWLIVQIEKEMIDESTPGRMRHVDATRRAIRDAIYNVVSALERGEHEKESRP